MSALQAISAVIAAYIIGSIPFSIIIARLRGVNLLDVGSKNAGATNVYRNLGFKYALLTFLLDMGKGYLTVSGAAYLSGQNYTLVVLCALAVIIGHTFTPFLRFKGGKGVATGIGVILLINPIVALISFVTGITIILIFRIVSIASIIGSLMVLAGMYLPGFDFPWQYRAFVTVAVIYVIYKHRANIGRLLQGKENKI